MSIARTCTAVTLAASAALTATALAVAPAQAGGAPDDSTVTVDRQARLAAGQVTLSGTYSCTVPDAASTSGPGTIGVELVTRSGVATSASVAVTCDGTTRDWRVTAPAGSLGPGRAWVHGHVEVTDTAGNTPWNLFDTSVAVVRRG
ncbi:DUF6299 family protein [Terrabacter sp. 2RAF25]|uniref:DUF6299 family protein n=1 Tax=Terrabacter sp. 2RAF25 TaxID=3232998 RepID=UPI003F94DB0B